MEITRRNPAAADALAIGMASLLQNAPAHADFRRPGGGRQGGRGAAKGVAGCRLDYEPGLLAA